MATITPPRPRHYDAADLLAVLTHDTSTTVCPGCSHSWPTDELTIDHNGDRICPDCVWLWSTHYDHR